MMSREKVATFGEQVKTRALAIDDGTILKTAFYTLLAAAAVFVVIDWNELNAAQRDQPGLTEPGLAPVLPPALTEGEPDDAPADITADPKTLRDAIRFELQPGGILLAQGSIDPGAADRFKTEIDARGEYVKTVLLNSPGGSVGDALAISKLIRERQLNTKVATGALCASSCPIVMAGGVKREAERDAVIGVHQIFNGSREQLSPERAMSEAQRTTAEVSRHLEEMGIKSGLWLHAMETPPDRLYYLNQKQMQDLALTTDGATPVADKAN